MAMILTRQYQKLKHGDRKPPSPETADVAGLMQSFSLPTSLSTQLCNEVTRLYMYAGSRTWIMNTQAIYLFFKSSIELQ